MALVPLLEEMRPDVVVSDILTLAPALAAEMAGCRRVTLIPHVYPVHEPGMPFFAFGWMPPRTRVGRGGVAGGAAGAGGGAAAGTRGDERDARERWGCRRSTRFHGGISEELALVATFPQLEYPRRWPAARAT